MINRRDLRAQIKERDEQIAFLINHFGDESVSKSHGDSIGGDGDGDHTFNLSMGSEFSASARSHALSQIEANLTVAMAPFQRDDDDDDDDEESKQRKNNGHHHEEDENEEQSSPYRIVPATSSS